MSYRQASWSRLGGGGGGRRGGQCIWGLRASSVLPTADGVRKAGISKSDVKDHEQSHTATACYSSTLTPAASPAGSAEFVSYCCSVSIMEGNAAKNSSILPTLAFHFFSLLCGTEEEIISKKLSYQKEKLSRFSLGWIG